MGDWREKYVTVFTDASFCDKTGCYGWAIWIKWGNPAQTKRLIGGGCASAKRNRRKVDLFDSTQVETFALHTALRALQYYNIPYKGKVVVLQSDSSSALANVSMMKTDVHNKAENIRYKHVRAHQGKNTPRSSVNTWCDREARRKMRRWRRSLILGNDE